MTRCRPRQVFVMHDRYSATGRPRPAPGTACKKCEGMGFYPDMRGDRPAAGREFIRCAQCNGTGRRKP